MKISILIPVFNEEKYLREIIKAVNNAKIFGWEKEIIIIDDASTDNTGKILEELKKSIGFKLVKHKKNRGKGSAIKTGLSYASGDYVLIQDADLEYDPGDYEKLLLPIERKEAEIVYGSRNIHPKRRGYFLNFWGGKLLTFTMNFLFGSSLTDINTCYKVIKADIFKNIDFKATRFEFCEEITASLLKSGKKIVEVPVSYNPRKIKDGKKLRWVDGASGFLTILRLKFFN